MRTDFDAVIIGAGPAGSTAAIVLARAGWSVALVEKQSFPRRKVCGECIAASNLPLIDALGIGAAFDAHAGPPIRQVAFMRGDDQVVADLPASDHPGHRWGRAFGREQFDTLLLERARAAGAVVLQPASVQCVHGDAGDWHFRVRQMGANADSALRARVAIAAHGSWEVLPSGRAARRLARLPSDLFAFKANFDHSTLPAGLLPVLSFDGGYGGMVVADRGLTTLACCIRADRLDDARRRAPGTRAGDVVEQLLKRECLGVRQALNGATLQGGWLSAGPIDPGVRVRADDGMFRIGNAAGEAHPIIGEGMSMAMQSAWLLCALLLDDPPRDVLLRASTQRDVARRYAQQWHRQFGLRLAVAGVFARVASGAASASALMALARFWPGLLTLGARAAGKVAGPGGAIGDLSDGPGEPDPDSMGCNVTVGSRRL